MTDIVERLRTLHREITECDGGECEMMAMVRHAADEIEQLRAIIGPQVHCRSCGTVVPLAKPDCDCVQMGTPEKQRLGVYDEEAIAEIERLSAATAWRPRG